MKKCFLIIVFLFTSISFGQNKEINPLKEKLLNVKEDIKKIDLNIKIASQLNHRNQKEANVYANEAIRLTRKNNFKDKEFFALIELARYYEEYSSKDSTIAKYNQIIDFGEKSKNNELLNRAYNMFANYNVRVNEHEKAINYFLKSLKLNQTLEQKFFTLEGLANLYISRRKFEKVCEYISEAYEISKELNDIKKQISSIFKLGKCTMFLKDFEKSEEYLKKTILLSEKSNLKKFGAYAYMDLGQIFWNVKKDTLKAIAHFEKGYRIGKQINYNRLIHGSELILGNAYLKSGKKEEGLALLKKSYTETKKNNTLEYSVQSAKVLAKYYEGQKEVDSALVWNKNYSFTKDTLTLIKKQKAFKEIEIKHEVGKKEKKIIDLNEDNLLLKSNLNRLWPILTVLFIILLILFFYYNKYYKKSEILEVEKQLASKKIDELKSIVVKNHIVLKDKTKVYIVDLMYIKSDDHYLNIYLSNGKNHFVRGKLSKISQELPPNFIRCHRSYIVNSNFIKQTNSNSLLLINNEEIPISRSYKNNL